MSGSLRTVAGESANYNLDLVAVKEIRRDEYGNQPAEIYIFFYGNGNANHHLRPCVGLIPRPRSPTKCLYM
jgi:hypothetical protein